MESASPEISVEVAVKGLSVLSAIFVVLFALWGQYFTDYAQGAADEAPGKYDPRPDLTKVRMAGVMTVFFQFFLFLGTDEVRVAYPLTANTVFILALVAQGIIQASVEKKLRELGKTFEVSLRLAEARAAGAAGSIASALSARSPTEISEGVKPIERVVDGLRGMLWCMLAGAAHVGVFGGVMTVTLFAVQAAHFSKPLSAALVILGAALALGVSLAGAFALAPLQIRKAFKVSPVGDCGLRAEVTRLFRDAGLSAPGIWILETERAANAMISGFGKGRGWFTPAIFLSRRLVESLDDDELRAIVLHEVSHARLKHLRKRFVFTAAIVASGLIIAVFAIAATSLYHVGVTAGAWLGPVVAFAQVSAFLALVGRQSRRHEAEADLHAVDALGASAAALVAALGKVDTLNRRTVGARSITHPSTEARIAALRTRLVATAAGASGAAAPDAGDRAA